MYVCMRSSLQTERGTYSKGQLCLVSLVRAKTAAKISATRLKAIGNNDFVFIIPIETQTTKQTDSNIADIPLMLDHVVLMVVVKFGRGGGRGGGARRGKAGCSKGYGWVQPVSRWAIVRENTVCTFYNERS